MPEGSVGTKAAREGLVDERLLQAHVERLAGTIGERNVFHPRALGAARRYIEQVFKAQGYAVATDEFQTHGEACANLEVTHPGARSKEILLIGAHYDSVAGSPGANDNGSGVAAMLELSRLFAMRAPGLTLRFVAFVNEEPPFFATPQQGSLVYAKAARARGDRIRLMVSLETIGYYQNAPGSQHYPAPFSLFYPNRGNFLSLVSDLRARSAMRKVARCFRENSDFPLEHVATFRFVPGVSWSDHRSFWQLGYRALLVTDTAPFRYPYYHTSADTPDKLCYPEFTLATEGLYKAFAAFAMSEANGVPPP